MTTSAPEGATRWQRRDVLKTALGAAAALGGASGLAAVARAQGTGGAAEPWFRISLAQWSLHRTLEGPGRPDGLTNLEFPAFTKRTFGIEAIEYVNRFFRTVDAGGEVTDRAHDFGYLRELDAECKDAGVRSLLIMVDGEGSLADPDDARRRDAVENHFKWIAASAFLGGHAIRVNAAGKGEPAAQAERAADSLKRIARVSRDYGVSVIVENHGGLSSDGAWLKGVMEACDDEFVGTLPDFGNFGSYDRYQGVRDLMPFAKAVSAKSHEFDDAGSEVHTDYSKVMKIVQDAGYRGWVGVEYEGRDGDEVKGIEATRDLLVRVRDELS